MSEPKQQVLVGLTSKLLKEIENFQFENRIKSRSEAIRLLLEEGIRAANK